MAIKPIKLFISYSHKDIQFVDKLVADLEINHFIVWVDKNAMGVGTRIDSKIKEGIEKSDFYIIILSQNAVKSNYVMGEMKAAFNLQKARNIENFIVPVLFQPCEIPIQLLTIHYANFVKNYQSGLVELLKSLRPQNVEESETDQDEDDALKWLESLVTKRADERRPNVPEPKFSPSALWILAQKVIDEKKAQISEKNPYCFGDPIGNLYEVGPSPKGVYALVQKYDRGMIVFHTNGQYAGKAFGMYGGIGYRYRVLGEFGLKLLGFPITDESDAVQSTISNLTGKYNSFENGEIVWRKISESQYYENVIPDPYRKMYDARGGSGSFLGFPLSNPYKINSGERLDFEGGVLFRSNSTKDLHYIRQLLRVDYSDSPLNHNWDQYDGPDDPDCANVLIDTRAGWNKNSVELSRSWQNRGIRFPENDYSVSEICERYCAVTFRRILPNEQIRVFIGTITNADNPQYLVYDSQAVQAERAYLDEKGVDYWRMPMPSELVDGDWHSIIVDLKDFIEEIYTKSFISLKGFFFKGDIGVAELLVSDDLEALKAVTINPIVMKGPDAH